MRKYPAAGYRKARTTYRSVDPETGIQSRGKADVISPVGRARSEVDHIRRRLGAQDARTPESGLHEALRRTRGVAEEALPHVDPLGLVEYFGAWWLDQAKVYDPYGALAVTPATDHSYANGDYTLCKSTTPDGNVEDGTPCAQAIGGCTAPLDTASVCVTCNPCCNTTTVNWHTVMVKMCGDSCGLFQCYQQRVALFSRVNNVAFDPALYSPPSAGQMVPTDRLPYAPDWLDPLNKDDYQEPEHPPHRAIPKRQNTPHHEAGYGASQVTGASNRTLAVAGSGGRIQVNLRQETNFRFPQDKEKKGRANNALTLLVKSAINGVTEGLDAFYAVFNALPEGVRKGCFGETVRSGGRPGIQADGECLAANFDQLVFEDVVVNLIANQIEDAVIGRIAQGRAQAAIDAGSYVTGQYALGVIKRSASDFAGIGG